MTARITREQTINGYRIRQRGEDVLIDNKTTGYSCVVKFGSYDEECEIARQVVISTGEPTPADGPLEAALGSSGNSSNNLKGMNL